MESVAQTVYADVEDVEIDFEDTEISDIFDKIYNMEGTIQRSLDEYGVNYNEMTERMSALDSSCNTISVLMEESKKRKDVILELSATINALYGLREVDKYVQSVDKEIVSELQQSNIECQSCVHSMELELETLRMDNMNKMNQIESFEHEIQSLETMVQSTRQQNEMMKKHMELIQNETIHLQTELAQSNHQTNLIIETT